MKRRQYLKSAGSGVAAIFGAGCAGIDSGDPDHQNRTTHTEEQEKEPSLSASASSVKPIDVTSTLEASESLTESLSVPEFEGSRPVLVHALVQCQRSDRDFAAGSLTVTNTTSGDELHADTEIHSFETGDSRLYRPIDPSAMGTDMVEISWTADRGPADWRISYGATILPD